MSRNIKLILYAVLLVAACVLGAKFHRVYKAVMGTPLRPALVDAGETPGAGATDEVVRATAPLATNLSPPTNAAAVSNVLVVPGATNLTQTPSGTNSPITATNLSRSNTVVYSKAAVERALASAKAASAADARAAAAPTLSTLMSYGAVLFLVVVSLGLLLAHDFSHFVADRFVKFALSDEGEGFKAPEYERAEQVWADGQPLQAIQLMRDYLKGHPRELYVALRIAEIYEKDLGNYLAAALEYEEVLKHRLRPDQWGWAAIHLANLYSGKLNQVDKAVALLRRIVSEYGQTPAAAKAQSRLSQLEGERGEAPATAAEIEEDPVPPSNLPKGFRPKQK
jgi:TolA-binding protein